MEWNFSLNNIHEVAKSFWSQIGDKKIIALHGKMGAGKTTLIHALCEVKGVKENISSPTFSIINEYFFTENDTEKTIFHIDLYRLRSEDEALQAGVEDCFLRGALCLVEWPGIAKGLLPHDAVHVYITTLSITERQIRLNSTE